MSFEEKLTSFVMVAVLGCLAVIVVGDACGNSCWRCRD